MKSRPEPELVPTSLTMRYTLLVFPPIAVLRDRGHACALAVSSKVAYVHCKISQLEFFACNVVTYTTRREEQALKVSELSRGEAEQARRVVLNSTCSRAVSVERVGSDQDKSRASV